MDGLLFLIIQTNYFIGGTIGDGQLRGKIILWVLTGKNK